MTAMAILVDGHCQNEHIGLFDNIVKQVGFGSDRYGQAGGCIFGLKMAYFRAFFLPLYTKLHSAQCSEKYQNNVNQ